MIPTETYLKGGHALKRGSEERSHGVRRNIDDERPWLLQLVGRDDIVLDWSKCWTSSDYRTF